MVRLVRRHTHSAWSAAGS